MNQPNRIIDLGIWAIDTTQAWALRIEHVYNGAEAYVAHRALRRGGVVTPERVEEMAVAEFCDAMGWPHPDGPVVDVELVNTCDGCGAPEESECVCFMMNSKAASGWALKGAW